MAEERTNIIKIVVDAEEAQKQLSQNLLLIEKNKDAIKEETKERQKRIKELKEQGASEKEINSVLKESVTKVNTLRESNKKLGSQNRDLQKDIDVVRGSLNEQRLQLVRLNRQYDSFRVGIDGTEEDFKALGERIKKVSDNVKGQEEATGRAQRNVGNYAESIKQAANDMGLADGALGQFQSSLNQTNKILSNISGSLSDLGKDLKDVAQGQKTAADAAKILSKAMIAIPIIAIVTAFTALVSIFASTQEGADKLNKIFQPLRVGFEKLLGIAQDLASGVLTDLFNDPIQVVKDLGNAILENVINRFKAVAILAEGASDIFSGDFSKGAESLKDGFLQLATGVEDFDEKVMDATDSVVDFFNEAVEEGEKYANLQIKVEEQEIRLIEIRGQLNKTSAEQRKIAEDTNKTLTERLDALDKATEAEKKLRDERIKAISLQITLMELEASFNDTSRETQKELALLREERSKIDEDYANSTKELQNKQNSLMVQAEQEHKEELIELDNFYFVTVQGMTEDANNRMNAEMQEGFKKRLKLQKDYNDKREKNTKDTNEVIKLSNQETIDVAIVGFSQLSSALSEYAAKDKGLSRVIATLDFMVELGSIWRNAFSPASPANQVTMGVAGSIIGGINSAASAVRYGVRLNEINKAAGGGKFITNKPTLLMVGDNPGGVERVTVEPLSGTGKTSVNPNSGLIRMAGGGELISRPQTLAADISNDATRSVMKTIKDNQMVLPVEQVNEVNRRITAVESLSRL